MKRVAYLLNTETLNTNADSHRSMYMVAQIKIYRTNCNFSTTVWGFHTKISWLIWERSCYNCEI